MQTRLVAAVLLLGLLVTGCATRQDAAPREVTPRSAAKTVSVVPTEALAGGGARASTITAGLLLVTEVGVTDAAAGGKVPVRVTLTNTTDAPVRWDDFSLGWAASVSGPTSLDGVAVGLGPGPRAKGPTPLTLASGEATTMAQPLEWAGPGVYRLYGAYEGFTAGAKATGTIVKTPELVVTVR